MCPCNFHPPGWLRVSALSCRLISLVGVKWSCLRFDKQAFLSLILNPNAGSFTRGIRPEDLVKFDDSLLTWVGLSDFICTHLSLINVASTNFTLISLMKIVLCSNFH
jgi:hypothetical protein